MKIPIQNIYYLFVYAWNRVEEAKTVDVTGLPSRNLENLIARLLIKATEHILRRGLDRGYVQHQEATTTLRGRINFNESIKRNLLREMRAVCEFDEFTPDVLHNQILRSTVRRLSWVSSVDEHQRRDLAQLYRRLDGIRTIRLDNGVFGRVQLHGNNAFYAFILNVCRLAHSAMLPEQGTGRLQFRDILDDEQRMRRVFEEFVFNFYRIEQSVYQVKVDLIDWDATGDKDILRLPKMRTDISLRSADRTIIIDTKYYRDPLQQGLGSPSARSGNLYQIFSYLMNLEARGGADGEAEGILLYPTVDKDIDATYDIKGHRVRVATLNLAQDWQCIDRDLRRLIGLPEKRIALAA